MIENVPIVLMAFLALFLFAIFLMLYDWLYIKQVEKMQSQMAIKIPRQIKNLLLLTVGFTATSLVAIILLVGFEII